jgi:hypothetical protein
VRRSKFKSRFWYDRIVLACWKQMKEKIKKKCELCTVVYCCCTRLTTERSIFAIFRHASVYRVSDVCGAISFLHGLVMYAVFLISVWSATMTDGYWSIHKWVVWKDKLDSEESWSLQASSRYSFVSNLIFFTLLLRYVFYILLWFVLFCRLLSNSEDSFDFYIKSKGITIRANTCILRCRCPQFYYEVIKKVNIGNLPLYLLEQISDFIK